MKKNAEEDENPQRIDGERRAERAHAEEIDVDQRLCEPRLPSNEQSPEREPEKHRRHRLGADAVLRELLQPVHDGEDRDERERGTEQIELSGIGVPVLRQQDWAEHEEQRHHRNGEEKDGAPPEELEQHASEQRTERTAERERGDPHADRDGALCVVLEHVPDQRER